MKRDCAVTAPTPPPTSASLGRLVVPRLSSDRRAVAIRTTVNPTGDCNMDTPHCPFVWYELMTSDDEAAAAFYRQVIGWQTADAGMPGMR